MIVLIFCMHVGKMRHYNSKNIFNKKLLNDVTWSKLQHVHLNSVKVFLSPWHTLCYDKLVARPELFGVC